MTAFISGIVSHPWIPIAGVAGGLTAGAASKWYHSGPNASWSVFDPHAWFYKQSQEPIANLNEENGSRVWTWVNATVQSDFVTSLVDSSPLRLAARAWNSINDFRERHFGEMNSFTAWTFEPGLATSVVVPTLLTAFALTKYHCADGELFNPPAGSACEQEAIHPALVMVAVPILHTILTDTSSLLLRHWINKKTRTVDVSGHTQRNTSLALQQSLSMHFINRYAPAELRAAFGASQLLATASGFIGTYESTARGYHSVADCLGGVASAVSAHFVLSKIEGLLVQFAALSVAWSRASSA
jgi:hypothetical protein